MLVMTVAVTRNQLVAFINIDDVGGNSRLLVMQLLRVLEMSGEYRRRLAVYMELIGVGASVDYSRRGRMILFRRRC